MWEMMGAKVAARPLSRIKKFREEGGPSTHYGLRTGAGPTKEDIRSCTWQYVAPDCFGGALEYLGDDGRGVLVLNLKSLQPNGP